jgi:hypothetical protein
MPHKQASKQTNKQINKQTRTKIIQVLIVAYGKECYRGRNA